MTYEPFDNLALEKCLCCGQAVTQRGSPITEERAQRSWRIFQGMGFTREHLLTKHRAQLDYQSPGFAEWLERQPDKPG